MANTPFSATVLSIAGSDPGAGAGVQADLKTLAACGVYGCTVVTALTAQNTQGVTQIWPVPAAAVAAQLETLLDDLTPAAIKIGMLHNATVVSEVVAALKRLSVPVVWDPIVGASSGAALLSAEGLALAKQQLLPLATLITPNLNEAAALLETEVAPDAETMAAQARQLLDLGPRAVLLTGGHLAGDSAADVLARAGADNLEWFRAERVDTPNTHGTGCTLSSAIAAGLARGREMTDAISQAKHYVQEALHHGKELRIGRGNGPLHHFFNLTVTT